MSLQPFTKYCFLFTVWWFLGAFLGVGICFHAIFQEKPSINDSNPREKFLSLFPSLFCPVTANKSDQNILV